MATHDIPSSIVYSSTRGKNETLNSITNIAEEAVSNNLQGELESQIKHVTSRLGNYSAVFAASLAKQISRSGNKGAAVPTYLLSVSRPSCCHGRRSLR
jgi:hypothetical protein